MPARFLLLFSMFVLTVVTPAASQEIKETAVDFFDLLQGPHKVGFSIVHVYDNSRDFPAEYLEPKWRSNRSGSRPLQISVWYPASDTQDESMSLGDYIRFTASQWDFSRTTTEDREQRFQDYLARLQSNGIDKDALAKMLQIRVMAVKDAPDEIGSFPLLIYSPSLSSSPFEQFLLIELLVSHGFIVAGAPSTGPQSPAMPENITGLDAHTRDLQVTLGEMHSYPNVDTQNIGAFGFSWGGWCSTMLQITDTRIDALATLDGTPGFLWESVLRHFENYMPYEYPAATTVPLLEFQGFGKGINVNEPNTEKLYFKAYYNDAWMKKIKQLQHFNFASTSILLGQFTNPDLSEEKRENLKKSYELICNYTTAFFKAHLKQDKIALDFLNIPAKESGYDRLDLLEYSRKAEPAPLTGQALFDFLNEVGVKEGIDYMREVRTRMPGFRLFGPREMPEFATELFQKGDQAGAVDILKFATEVYPRDHRILFFLGEAQRYAGMKEAAIDTYRKALKLNTPYPAAERIESLTGKTMKLQEMVGKRGFAIVLILNCILLPDTQDARKKCPSSVLFSFAVSLLELREGQGRRSRQPAGGSNAALCRRLSTSLFFSGSAGERVAPSVWLWWLGCRGGGLV
jgi:tetratricopeptide (TPR) repeat protein